jgi:hypothetical protein
MKEILDSMKKKIEEAMRDDNLNRNDLLLFELAELFIIYLTDDHPKTQLMWSVFKPLAWTVIVATTTLIGLFVSGKITIIIK